MEREKISGRTLLCLLLAEWIAKLCVLMPFALSELEPGGLAASIFAGLLFWCIAVGFVLRQPAYGRTPDWEPPSGAGREPAGREYAYERESDWKPLSGADRESAGRGYVYERTSGGVFPVLLCFAGIWYYLAHAAVFLRLGASLLQTYLFPRISPALLCLLPGAAALWILGRGGGLRAGVYRFAGVGLTVLIAVLACMAGDTAQIGVYGGTAADRVVWGGYEVFACVGGMFLPFFLPTLAGGNADRAHAGRIVRLAGCVCAVLAGGFCIAAGMLCSGEERWRSDFPAVEALRRLRLFGADPGRLEMVFVLLMVVGLTLTAAGGIRYLRGFYELLCGRFLQDRPTAARNGWIILLLLVFVLASGFTDAFAALTFYRAYNMQIMIPAALGICLASFLARSAGSAGILRRKRCGSLRGR